ncbi:MAG: pitrilysin family protein [Candidatus Kapaibacterium sp.]
MNKMIKLLVVAIIFSQFAIAQDYKLGEKPEPLESKKFEFPAYKEATLDNGLRVFVIEDHEQPMLSFNILMPGGDALESKKDAAGFAAALIMKGTKTKSAFDISKVLDGLGANLSVSNSTEFTRVSGSSIIKHKEVLFDMLVDVMTNPTFPKEELDKIKVQAKAGIKSEKGDPGSLASNMSKKALFGLDHPYASVSTEETVDAITVEDIKKYYKDFYLPNSSSMVIVGDFKTDDIIKELNKKLATWKKGDLVKLEIPAPKPMPKGIYFIERKGSVQSAVRYANMTVPFNDADYMNINVASHVINSSFAGRMFKIIREKHSYTYSPTGGHSSNRFYNYSIFGSDVRNDVTDSTIISINDEILGDLYKNGPSKEEMETIKQFRIGQFYLSFESSGFLGSLIQSYDFKGVPIRMIKEYPNQYDKVSALDVQKAVTKYLNPADGYVIVVGDPSVKEQLEKFGTVFTYDTDYKPATGLTSASIDADDLLENYTKALGGEDELKDYDVIQATGIVSMSASGQNLPGKTEMIYTKTGKMYRLVDLNVYKSEELYNGTTGWEISTSGTIMKEGNDLKSMKFDADPFKYANAVKHGYNLQVKGKKGNQVVAEMKEGDKLIETLYFNSESYLLEKVEMLQDTPRGSLLVVVNYSDYKDVDGMKLPTVSKTETPMFNMETTYEYKVNAMTFPDSKFEPAK